MNPSETAFLVLGLVIGTAIGAALWQAVRGRPAARREVRLTVTPNSVPVRRASTLAVPGGTRGTGPLPGSPDGDASTEDAHGLAAGGVASAAQRPGSAMHVRTSVPSVAPGIPMNAVAVPIVADAASALPAHAPSVGSAVPLAGLATVAVGSAASSGRVSQEARTRASAMSASLTQSARAVAVLEPPPARSTRSGAQRPAATLPGPGSGAGAGQASSAAGTASMAACTDERRLVDERCALADAAREEARRTTDALRTAQRAYDALRERVERAQDAADPRRVAEAKARLHAAFRAANEKAATPDQAEAAAREWLDAINRLNAAVRDAARLGAAGNVELQGQLPGLERLAIESETARIASENATEGCTAARARLAECEEAGVHAATAAAGAIPTVPEEEHPFARVWPAEEPAFATPEPVGPAADGVSAIIRVLRGDRDARERIVAAIAGPDPDAQRGWHLRLAALVDAITARAIEDGYLDLPRDDIFWGLFDIRETRDIVGALSALGFRYDGMGGFADERVPATRDLSLAVGYAGLDRMRIRQWPRDEVMGRLYAGAVVACDEWLVDQAGDLSLGRMVDALGARAASLADLWNAWGRVRPVLLAA